LFAGGENRTVPGWRASPRGSAAPVGVTGGKRRGFLRDG